MKGILAKRETSHFCSQLKMMLASGIPLLEALTVIQGIAVRKKYSNQIRMLINRVTEGYSLSESALGFLPPLAIGSLRAAERAGNLEETLENLSKYFENQADFEEKVIGAFIYPTFVLGLSFLIVFALIFFVLPTMKGLFADLGGELPLITNAILSLGDYLSWWCFFLAGLLGVGGWLLLRQKDSEKIEQIVLRIPFFGKLIRQEVIIHGFGTLGTLLNGGTPMLEALIIAADTSRSVVFKKIIWKTRKGVENGEKLSEELGKFSFFPEETMQMLKVGENSGRLGQMLLDIANFLAKEREISLKRFTTLLEPAMTLAVGLVVGLIVLAIFLPVINMISKLQ
jgi:type IV pilus assembly protein PilC